MYSMIKLISFRLTSLIISEMIDNKGTLEKAIAEIMIFFRLIFLKRRIKVIKTMLDRKSCFEISETPKQKYVK